VLCAPKPLSAADIAPAVIRTHNDLRTAFFAFHLIASLSKCHFAKPARLQPAIVSAGFLLHMTLHTLIRSTKVSQSVCQAGSVPDTIISSVCPCPERRGMHPRAARALAIGVLASIGSAASALVQQTDAAVIIRDLDAANQARYDNVLGFTVTEHYSVFRGANQMDAAAQMIVRTTYKRGVGKSYQILSQSGSELVIKYGLRPLLDNEKAINDPVKVSQSWFTSANYEMKLKPGVSQIIDDRPCLAFAITPRHKAPNMVDGTLWVDARDHTLLQVEGIASKSPSIFAGTTHMMRRYADMNGYSMATHARAESGSLLFGRTVVTIDYSDYQFQLRPQR
jgi:hypothetical protein